MSESSIPREETQNTPLVLPDSIPQALGSLALLTPEQEILRRSWVHETDPDSKVESFLEATSGIFVASGQAWYQIKLRQNELTELNAEVAQQSATNSIMQNRKNRRGNKKTEQLASPAATFAHVKHGAMSGFSKLEGKTVQEKILKFAGQVQELQPEYDTTLGSVKGVRNKFARLAAQLLDSHFWTHATQDLAENEIATLLNDDPETSRSFVRRVHELAHNARFNVFEYPGFLEIIAFNHAIAHKESLLRRASNTSALPTSHYALDFLNNTTISHSREAGGVIKSIRRSVEFIGNRPPDEALKKSYLKFMADSIGELSQDLRGELEAYTLARNNEAHIALEAAVKPSLRVGRLPTQVHGTRKILVTDNGALRSTKRVKTGRSRNGERQIVPMFTPGKEGQDHEDITEERQPPITRFAFFTGNGGREDHFSLGPIGDLDTVLAKGNLRNYIDNYRGDNALEPAIRAALESLSEDPFNRERTTRLIKGRYALEPPDNRGDTQQRNMRRLSMQRFPGVTTGKIGNKTRILYDIIPTEDGPVIALFGAVFKQTSEKSDGLPRR